MKTHLEQAIDRGIEATQKLKSDLAIANAEIERLNEEIEVRKATAKLVLDRVQLELIKLRENK